jgi:hypothetical protein
MKGKLYFKKKISCGSETVLFLFVLSSKTSYLKAKECSGESIEKILKKHFLYTGTSTDSVINRTVAE